MDTHQFMPLQMFERRKRRSAKQSTVVERTSSTTASQERCPPFFRGDMTSRITSTRRRSRSVAKPVAHGEPQMVGSVARAGTHAKAQKNVQSTVVDNKKSKRKRRHSAPPNVPSKRAFEPTMRQYHSEEEPPHAAWSLLSDGMPRVSN